MQEKPTEKCNAPVECYARVCGFFRPVQGWNKGKKEEFKQRREFVIPKTTGSMGSE